MKIDQDKIVLAIIMAIGLYLAIAGIRFNVNHPWATPTQQMMCLKEVLLFQNVDRNEIDPR